jgi:hypothetical protein
VDLILLVLYYSKYACYFRKTRPDQTETAFF